MPKPFGCNFDTAANAMACGVVNSFASAQQRKIPARDCGAAARDGLLL